MVQNKPFQRLIADNTPCVECGHLAVVGTQQFKPTGRALLDAGRGAASEARVELTYTLCFYCLRRERWGWLNDTWQKVEPYSFLSPATEPEAPKGAHHGT